MPFSQNVETKIMKPMYLTCINFAEMLCVFYRCTCDNLKLDSKCGCQNGGLLQKKFALWAENLTLYLGKQLILCLTI